MTSRRDFLDLAGAARRWERLGDPRSRLRDRRSADRRDLRPQPGDGVRRGGCSTRRRSCALATSTAGITAGAFLGKLDAAGAELGLVVSAGPLGATAAAVLATFAADRLGRRRFLVLAAAEAERSERS